MTIQGQLKRSGSDGRMDEPSSTVKMSSTEGGIQSAYPDDQQMVVRPQCPRRSLVPPSLAQLSKANAVGLFA